MKYLQILIKYIKISFRFYFLLFFNNTYKYIYGEFTDYNQARQKLNYVKDKGYNDAFIVKFRNGKRVL